MIRLENISKIYNMGKKNEFLVLNNITLEICPGDMVAVTGKSGAGKSTLLHVLAFMDSFDRGVYYWKQTEIKKFTEKHAARMRNEKIGIVMQDYALIEDFTAYENIVLPVEIANKRSINKREKVMAALETVKMEDYMNHKVAEMSGGQKQRIAIARAIVNEPEIIFADEPTGALDSENTDIIMQLFHLLNEEGKTIVMVTHDGYIANQCKKIIKRRDGEIVDAVTEPLG